MIFFIFHFSLPVSVGAQENDSKQNNLNTQIVKAVFSDFQTPIKQKRVILNFEGKKLGFKINPMTYIAAGMLFFYQNIISEQISANCTYEMSCSEYTKKCIEKYGLIKGALIGLHQLSCCVPMIENDYCDHKISINGKIINTIE